MLLHKLAFKCIPIAHALSANFKLEILRHGISAVANVTKKSKKK